MPCSSEHMEPQPREREMSRVMCLLDELDGKKWDRSSWAGFHPSAYCQSNTQQRLDKATAQLCRRLRKRTPEEISKLSLELQMWWRDHQALDQARMEEAIEQERKDRLKQAALEKLTKEEREVLGY